MNHRFGSNHQLRLHLVWLGVLLISVNVLTSSIFGQSNLNFKYSTPKDQTDSPSSPQAQMEIILNNITNPDRSAIFESWYEKNYQMLLITPNETDFISAAQRFAEWKTALGIPTLVVSNYSLYNGVDEPEKIRTAIQHYYSIYPIKYVLLMGDTGVIPIRYAHNPDGTVLGISESVSGSSPTVKPTDYYYAELTANWNIDNDSFWGEDTPNVSNSTIPELDYNPEVYVGRFPADNVDELNA
ncbi:MAG: C25 family cysteine peptidase, partial [Promethearchaeota archaeon]